MNTSEVTVIFHNDTGLLELRSSGSSMMLTQLEAALIYTLLKKSLGFRGRFMLWRLRKNFRSSSVEAGPE